MINLKGLIHKQITLRSSERQRICGDAEFLRVLGDDADGQEAEDEIVGLIADDLMIVQVPDGADCAGTVVHSAGESGDL